MTGLGRELEFAQRTIARFGCADPPRAADVLRVLEVGDGADLRWLLERQGPDALADFLAAEGWRLSRRSRLFWRSVFDVGIAEPAPLAVALWPLA